MNKPTNRVKAANVKPDYDAINERALLHMDDVLHHLDLDGGKYVGKEYKALNPHRNDGEPGSFSINTETGLWKDFATDYGGGDVVSYWKFVKGFKYQPEAAFDLEAFLDSLEGPTPTSPTPGPAKKPSAPHLREVSKEGILGALDEPEWTLITPVPPDAPEPPASYYQLGVPTDSYIYTDSTGHLLCRVLRFDKGNGEKEFRPITLWRNAAGVMRWEQKALPTPRPLYNLPDLTLKATAPVLIVEGEKAADAALWLFPNHAVTTTMNGAQSPHNSDLTPLFGRTIFIWPDNDDAGIAYAENITALIRSKAPKTPISIMKPLSVMPGFDAEGKPVLEPGFVPPKGWDAADAMVQGWTADYIRLLPAEAFEQIPVDNSYYTEDGKYRVTDEGVFAVSYVDGEPVLNLVCSRIDALAKTRDHDGENWGTLIVVRDPDGNPHEWAMPQAVMASPTTLRSELLRMGAIFPPAVNRDPVLNYLIAAKPEARARCVAHPGWVGDVFVLPDRVIGASDERVVLQTADPVGGDIFKMGGTLAEWQQHIATPSQGNATLVLAICAALTGPALKHLGEENGGFHFVGRSSIGKTTIIRVASSVWGGPEFVQTWRNTDNALESVAQRYNDTMLPLDEMSQSDTAKAGMIAYMLGNGKGKGRSSRTGMVRPVPTWRLMFLSTGEISLAEHTAASGGRVMAGQEVRLVNLPALATEEFGVFETIHGFPSSKHLVEHFWTMTATHFGHAGPAFIALLAHRDTRQAIVEAIRHGVKDFVETHVPAGADGQVQRVANRFGLVAAVGEIATRYGILPWQAGDAINAAAVCFNSFVTARGGVGNLEADQAIARVRHFLEVHGESRFTAISGQVSTIDDARATINRAGFRKATSDGRTEFFVLPEAWVSEICDGTNPTQVTKAVRDANLLNTGPDGKSTVQIRLPSMGKKRVYHLKPDILGEVPDSPA
jgi:uncharacterized protein (DUF927 family)